MSGTKKILVADDEPDLLEIMTLELEMAGFEPIAVDCGNAAIEVLGREHVDAVLSDIRMPNGTGTDILEHIVSRDDHVPIIFMSGFSDISREEALASGAAAYFNKPTDMTKVIKKLEKITLSRAERWQQDAPDAGGAALDTTFDDWSKAMSSGCFGIGLGGFGVKFKGPALKPGSSVAFHVGFGESALKGSGVLTWLKQTSEGSTVYGIEVESLEKDSAELYEKILAENPSKAFIPMLVA